MQNRNLCYRGDYLLYAIAELRGNSKHSNIKGKVKFYTFKEGSIVKVEIEGLPNEHKNNFFGFHIHEGEGCIEEEGKSPFETAGGHLNPENDEHPQHLGDLPIIYSNNGYAYMEFFTSRFSPDKVVNHTIIVHKNRDDLVTEPAGNSGERIACGRIMQVT